MSDNITTGELRTVERSQVTVEDGFNPRSDLGDLGELVASVARHEILQPLLVRRGDSGSLVLVDGHRRLAAASEAGLEQVPVLVREDLDGKALVASLVTALKREDLDPVDPSTIASVATFARAGEREACCGLGWGGDGDAAPAGATGLQTLGLSEASGSDATLLQ